MKPLRITWTFSSPVVNMSDYPTHLDGLVAFTVFEQAKAMGAHDPVALAQDLNHVFAQQDSANGPIWKASCLAFSPASEVLYTTLVRRNEAQAWQMHQDAGVIKSSRNTLSSTTGVNRAYFVQHPYQWMHSASAWCIADETELRAALADIKAIGKMVRNGFGRILDCTIIEDEAAVEKWRIRNLPLDVVGAADTQYAETQRLCVRPPYWQRTAALPAKEPML